jgi:hypothetical protein
MLLKRSIVLNRARVCDLVIFGSRYGPVEGGVLVKSVVDLRVPQKARDLLTG